MSTLTEETLRDDFVARFGCAPDALVRAPGRVNLIGEHTDYNGGFVLPAAINYFTYIAYRADGSGALEVVAKDFDGESVIIDLSTTPAFDRARSWPNYVNGVIEQLKKSGFNLVGGQLLISGNVPAGAGLSSSASLEMALIRALVDMQGASIDPTAAALMGQAAENEFVGINCGIMDQLISARGEPSAALLIDCADLSVRPVSIPDNWELLIVHSGVKRGLVDSHYNVRRKQCEAVAAHFGVGSLRAVSLAQLESAESLLDPVSFRRARHVLTENARTLAAAEALSQGDIDKLAALMAQSHDSMRDDFEITTPEVDQLVTILQEAAAGRGGARMTGGGFGGCVVAVAPAALISVLEAAVLSRYEQQTGCEPRLIRARASGGAFAN